MGSNNFIDNRTVKDMTDEELIQIWESALAAPIDEPISDFVAAVRAELDEREDIPE